MCANKRLSFSTDPFPRSHARPQRLPGSASHEELAAAITKLNRSPQVHGIMVEQPFPRHLLETRQEVWAAIAPEKASGVGMCMSVPVRVYAFCLSVCMEACSCPCRHTWLTPPYQTRTWTGCIQSTPGGFPTSPRASGAGARSARGECISVRCRSERGDEGSQPHTRAWIDMHTRVGVHMLDTHKRITYQHSPTQPPLRRRGQPPHHPRGRDALPGGLWRGRPTGCPLPRRRYVSVCLCVRGGDGCVTSPVKECSSTKTCKLTTGRSKLVGLPLALLLLAKNATVTIAHSKTPRADLQGM